MEGKMQPQILNQLNPLIGPLHNHRDPTRGGFANDQEYPEVEVVAYKPENITVLIT